MKYADDTEAARSKLKGEGVSAEAAKKSGEEWAQKAGSKIDSSVGPPSFPNCPKYTLQ